MNSKKDPWYLHAGLYLIIAVLVVILIKVAIIDPSNAVETENYSKKEARLRMKNIKEAEVLYEKKFGHYTGSLDTIVNFVKNDPFVDSIRNAFDSLSRRPSDPFVKLSSNQFTPESLYYTPRSHQKFILKIDTSTSVDTVVTRSGKILRVDTTQVIGANYYLEDPDGYGSIGSLDNPSLKNTASWE